MMSHLPAGELALKLQDAVAQQDWPLALALAGSAIIDRPDSQASFLDVAGVCFALGDARMGNAYLRLARQSPGPDASPLPLEPRLDHEEPDRRAARWLATDAERQARAAAGFNPLAVADFRLMAGGDVMLGRQMPGRVALRGSDAPLSDLATLIRSADMAMVNLETCVSTEGDFLDKGGRQPYYYHCLPEMLEVLISAGIHCVATGNNHAMDFGAQALAQQVDILDACGFLHFGAGRNAAEAALPRFASARGLTVAFIGIETETPVMAAGTASAGVRYAPMREMLRTVAGSIAIARAHADIVIVSPHWGANWQEAPTALTRDCARQLIDLGADAILGHSAHILQGVEFHAGCPIVYDMGSLLFDRVAQGSMKDAALFELTWNARRGCHLTLRPVRLRAARAQLAKGEDFERICAQLARLSTDLDPAVVFETLPSGLQFFGQPEPSPVRQMAKRKAPTLFDASQAPRVTDAMRRLRSNLVYATAPRVEGIWPDPLVVGPDLHILGARYASPVRPGRGFVCEVYFRAAPPPAAMRVEARVAALTDEGEAIFSYIHPVAEGIHPPARWRFEDVICDRVCVRPVKEAPAGVYRLCWSLLDLESGETLPMTTDDARLFHGQVVIGELRVSADAPGGVGGIANRPELSRAMPAVPVRYGGWDGRVERFWEDEALPWVTEALMGVGLSPLSGKPVVVREQRGVLIIRVETTAGDYFFKAGDTGNHFEPGLVWLLAKRWSDRIAAPLAIRPERGWMLTKSYGVELRSTGDKASRAQELQRVVAQLAEIQIASCKQVDQLLALGVPDRRLHLLPELFEQLLADPAAIHLGQPDGLQHEQLSQVRALLPLLRTVCRQLGEADYSAGLDHGDLHLGNLLVRAGKVTLFDWDTALVTHPFCSLLLPYHASGLSDSRALRSMEPLGQAYLTPWSGSTGQSVAQLMPVLNQAVWIAHVCRALFWSRFPDAREERDGRLQTLTTQWIQWWLQRTSVLIAQPPGTEMPARPQATAAAHPPKLATPDNPLLLGPDLMARLTGGTWSGLPEDAWFTGLSFKLAAMAAQETGNLYVAAPLDSRHGFSATQMRDMARQAYRAGAAAVIVPDCVAGLPDDKPRLIVPDGVDVLERLSRHVRDRLFTGMRVLVSGTEGKTGFKIMLHHVLSPQIPTHAVTNSSNLDFSIKASLASLRRQDRLAILEAAGTHPGRLAARSRIVRPHLFVLTEVGNEHINFHGSQQAVIESKADIVTGLVDGGFGLLNADSRNYAATRQAILVRKRVPLCLFGSERHCNGRLLSREFRENVWHVEADIEGCIVRYRLPLLGDHAPLASVSVLLAAYYLGADVARAAAQIETFSAYETQGVLRRLAHRGGEIVCYDNASRASVRSYESTLGMVARLVPPGVGGRKVAVIGQMIFLGDESEVCHARLAPWIDAAGFDRIILVGKHTDATFAQLKNPGAVIRRFPDYDRRTSGKDALQALIDATEAACNPGDLLFVKGEVDELGEYLRARELPPDRQPAVHAVAPRPAVQVPTPDASVLAGLRPLQISDIAHYRAAIDQTRRTTWQHYFPFIFLLGRTPGYRFLVDQDSGSLCIYLLRDKKGDQSLSVFLLPMPAQPAVIERCIQRVKAHNKADRASLFRVDADDAKLFAGRPNTRIVTCPQEYLYAPGTYADLSGNKNGNLRRAIGSIARRDDLQVLDYQTAYAAECKAVLDQWAELQRQKYGSILFGRYTRDCLDLYDQFSRRDLFGKVVRLEGRVCAFGFGGEMRTAMGNLFVAYSDLRIDGLNRFLWVQLLRSMDQLEFVNGGNAGDTPGLAFAKQSLRPVSLFQPHQVYAG